MKRRDFIKTSVVTIGAASVLGSCQEKKNIEKSPNQIARNKFKNITLPALGFGCMRLPMQGGDIDMDEFKKMADYGMKHGLNYFDTAYPYIGKKSEKALGKIIKDYPRDSFYIASKNPIYMLQDEDQVLDIFEEQLKNCQVDFFDFYLVHNINKHSIKNFNQYDVYNKLLKMKEQGKIKYLGFSFHDGPELLKEVLSNYQWDFCQLQINYQDWEMVNAKALYDLADTANVPIITMEPLRGGDLCDLPETVKEILAQKCPKETQASFGLRWVNSKENIVTNLSGMSNFEQMKQNIDTFIQDKPFDSYEMAVATEMVKAIQLLGEINCTSCKYCMELCERDINSPAIFSLYNSYKASKNKGMGAFQFKTGYSSLDENQKANNCIKCKLCTTNCPQNLDIPTLLDKVEKELKDIGYK